jgi:hypothetical protein
MRYVMTAPQRRDDTTNTDNTQSQQFVDADLPTSLEQEEILKADAVRHIQFGRDQAAFSEVEEKAAAQLRQLNNSELADILDVDADQHMQDATHQMELGIVELEKAGQLRHETVWEQLAVQIVQTPQQLVVWNDAVGTITQTVKQRVTVEQFAAAAEGDVIRGRHLREQIISSGVAIRHSLNQAIELIDDARRVVMEIVEFIAAVLTVLDHVPALKEALSQPLAALRPFVL